MSLFDALDFWTMPVSEKLPLGTDGEIWVLEANVEGQYHVIDRWCPQLLKRDEALVKFGTHLAKLAAVEV